MKIFKKITSIFLRIIISVILLFFLFQKLDKQVFLAYIKNADKNILFLAFLFFSSNYALCLYRWNMLLKAAQIHLPLKRIIISFCGAAFFSLFLPSTIGGDLARSLDLAAHTKRPREVVATVFLDRLSGYVALVIVIFLTLLFGAVFLKDKSIIVSLLEDKTVTTSIMIITFILLAILAVLFNRFLYSKVNRLLDSPNAGKIREAIRSLHEELHIFRRKKRVIVKNLIVSLLIQATGPVTFYITALSLGIKEPIIYFFIFLPIIGAITLLPISIGGLGVRENMAVLFFAKAGISQNPAAAISLLNFFFILLYGAIGGLVYVLTIRHRRIQHH